ncbi:MAG: hypothetical protein AAF791_14815 [Bacteroidota bacterium]
MIPLGTREAKGLATAAVPLPPRDGHGKRPFRLGAEAEQHRGGEGRIDTR